MCKRPLYFHLFKTQTRIPKCASVWACAFPSHCLLAIRADPQNAHAAVLVPSAAFLSPVQMARRASLFCCSILSLPQLQVSWPAGAICPQLHWPDLLTPRCLPGTNFICPISLCVYVCSNFVLSLFLNSVLNIVCRWVSGVTKSQKFSSEKALLTEKKEQLVLQSSPSDAQKMENWISSISSVCVAH